MKTLPFDFGNHTDKGLVREHNEDAMAIYEINGGFLFLVADGMGGHAAGNEASKIALDVIANYFSHLNHLENIPYHISVAVETANLAIYQYAQQFPEKKGMGTTLVVAFIYNNQITIGHVGDSRAYRFNPQDGLQLLTKDHSFVQELINNGIISEEEAHYHPRKNEITKALGISEKVNPDLQQIDIKPNDLFLFMTDGISSILTNSQIHEIVSNTNLTAQQIAEALVNAANDLGGYDNSTVQVVSYLDKKKEVSITNNSDTQKINTNIENLSENQFSNKKNIPKSNASDSPIRYYLFIAGAIITIALVLYYSLFSVSFQSMPSQPLPEASIKYKNENQISEEINNEKNKTEQPAVITHRYRVTKGDNLEKLARAFNFPVDSIIKRNELKNNQLKINTSLEFPTQGVYRVVKGDNLSSIAKKFGVYEKNLAKFNRLNTRETLKEGQEIFIPLKKQNN